MSKGTKQMRAGKLIKYIEALEVRLQALEDTRKNQKGVIDEGLLVRVDELTKVIESLKIIVGI